MKTYFLLSLLDNKTENNNDKNIKISQSGSSYACTFKNLKNAQGEIFSSYIRNSEGSEEINETRFPLKGSLTRDLRFEI